MSRGAALVQARNGHVGGAHRLAGLLALAATPTFALLAVLTALAGAGPMQALCAPLGLSGLGGMATMYGLMSLFHLGAWLRLAAGPGRGA